MPHYFVRNGGIAHDSARNEKTDVNVEQMTRRKAGKKCREENVEMMIGAIVVIWLRDLRFEENFFLR